MRSELIVKPLLVGFASGLIAFLSLVAIAYYATGLYLYSSVNIFSIVNWLSTWYLEYVLGYSAAVGWLGALVAFNKLANTKLNTPKITKGGLAASIASCSTCIALLACCAPFIVALATASGGFLLPLILNSREALTFSLVVLWASVYAYAYHTVKAYLDSKKGLACCSLNRSE